MKENIINYIPLKIYRYLRWRKDQKKLYRKNQENFCEEYAKLCYHAALLERRNKPREQILEAYDKKHQFVVDYLEKLCEDVIEKYQTAPFESHKSSKIWVFWWSGEETAPEIVKACLKSIREKANRHDVVFLDQNNYDNYVQFPDYILEKHEAGIISHAQFSDLLRFSLLADYGGVWIDATVFLSQPIPELVTQSAFYSLKTHYPDSPYFSKSRWCSYFLATTNETILFPFAKEFMLTYWQRSDRLVDYLLVDYTLGIAYDRFESVRKAMDALPENNFKRGMLMDTINQPYSAELFHALQNEDTFASKLSWRYGNPTEKTKRGELTNYGYLLSL